MKKVYKSKIGPEIVLPLAMVLGIVFVLSVFRQPFWVGPALLFPVIIFVVHMFATTCYIVSDNYLTIKSGLFYNKQIAIHTIRKISETNNPLSSPATSLDRLEIAFGQYDTVMISPKQKTDFINELLALNPQIEIKYKMKRDGAVKQ